MYVRIITYICMLYGVNSQRKNIISHSMNTKLKVITMALLALAACSNMAQAAGDGPGFKLWFANNVTDVENFDKITSPDCEE